MFAPGSLIIITEKPQVCYVLVKYNRGAIKGRGWLLETTQGNTILVTMNENHHYMQRVLFITDKPTMDALYREAISEWNK
jgi:hypothetical protein